MKKIITNVYCKYECVGNASEIEQTSNEDNYDDD